MGVCAFPIHEGPTYDFQLRHVIDNHYLLLQLLRVDDKHFFCYCLIHAHLSLVVPFLNGFHLFLPRVFFVALDEKWHVLFSGGGRHLRYS